MDKKTLIKEAAVELFRKTGNVTVREISTMTGVNVASINYYYGNKENLITELELVIVDELRAAIERIQSNSDSISSTKKLFIEEMYHISNNSPGFFKFLLNNFTNKDDYHNMTVLSKEVNDGPLRQFIDSLIRRATGITDDNEITNRAAIFFISLAVSIITAHAIGHEVVEQEFMIARFKDKEHYASYINTLFDVILKP